MTSASGGSAAPVMQGSAGGGAASSSTNALGTISTPFTVPLDKLVTSMSISSDGQNVVLAAKRGLFIVDLENPFEPPRLIQYMTKWEVTDVIWNPHPSRSNWIASTSNLKVLVWNLTPAGESSSKIIKSAASSGRQYIEYTLQSHQRAVSDLHWSCFEPELLATCSYDSYVHLWDLRMMDANPSTGVAGSMTSAVGGGVGGGGGAGGVVMKPTTSFCSWTGGATAVKWNRKSPFVLASSHDTGLKIWDIRKGSTPVTSITAHMTKIYGIDWSPRDENEILTCGQDQTVKFWNTTDPKNCKGTIFTSSPVWRARFTPFGNGIITMPQRKFYDLQLWSCKNLSDPVFSFKGHTDVVREFVWRQKTSAPDDQMFQLVTWSKDQTMRMWPIDADITRLVDHLPVIRHPPEEPAQTVTPALYSGAMPQSAGNSPFGSPNMSPETPFPDIRSKSAVFHGEMTTSARTAAALLPERHASLNTWKSVSRKRDRRSVSQRNSFVGLDDEDNDTSEARDLLPPLHGSDHDVLRQQPFGTRLGGSLEVQVSNIRRRFPTLVIEKVDALRRSITVSIQRSLDLSGGSPNDPISTRDAIIRVQINFPPESGTPTAVAAPNAAPPNSASTISSTSSPEASMTSFSHVPTFEIAKTGMLSMAQRTYLSSKLTSLNTIYSLRGESSLEPCLRFLVYGDSVAGSEESSSSMITGLTRSSSAMGAVMGGASSGGGYGASGFQSGSSYDEPMSAHSGPGSIVLARSVTPGAEVGIKIPGFSGGGGASEAQLARSFEGSLGSSEDEGFPRKGRWKMEQRLTKESVGMAGVKESANVPFPRLCGATFAPNGKLVYFFSPIPHPSTVKFTSYIIATRNQQPVLQPQYFPTQPKIYAVYETYRAFLLSKYPKSIRFGSAAAIAAAEASASAASANLTEMDEKQTIADALTGMGNKLDYWFDDDEDDEEEAVQRLFPKTKAFTQHMSPLCLTLAQAGSSFQFSTTDILNRMNEPVKPASPSLSSAKPLHPNSAPLSPNISSSSVREPISLPSQLKPERIDPLALASTPQQMHAAPSTSSSSSSLFESAPASLGLSTLSLMSLPPAASAVGSLGSLGSGSTQTALPPQPPVGGTPRSSSDASWTTPPGSITSRRGTVFSPAGSVAEGLPVVSGQAPNASSSSSSMSSVGMAAAAAAGRHRRTRSFQDGMEGAGAVGGGSPGGLVGDGERTVIGVAGRATFENATNESSLEDVAALGRRESEPVVSEGFAERPPREAPSVTPTVPLLTHTAATPTLGVEVEPEDDKERGPTATVLIRDFNFLLPVSEKLARAYTWVKC
ncbi:hypothetical protein HK101_000934 [Irineochytrium annulatum]|nr:hypothetical protein HK101_000934 [Irineochytrium annulatum]